MQPHRTLKKNILTLCILFAFGIYYIVVWKNFPREAVSHVEFAETAASTTLRCPPLNRVTAEMKSLVLKHLLHAQNIVRSFSPRAYYAVYSATEFDVRIEQLYWLAQYVLSSEGKTLTYLDIGCAYGTMLVFFKLLCSSKLGELNCNLYCLDFVPILSPSLAKHLNVKYSVSNIETHPFPFQLQNFDIIVLGEVLEHFNFHPFPTMNKIRNILSKNGILILSTPNQNDKLWSLSKTAKQYSHFSQLPYPNNSTMPLDAHIHQFFASEIFELAKLSDLFINQFLMDAQMQILFRKCIP
jgi:2-polyprenyl-3-methyl-5-hydroxy-6-metoxy-1,4-benzoquinol methylase